MNPHLIEMNPRLNVTNLVEEKQRRYKFLMTEANRTLHEITLLKFYQALYDVMVNHDLTIIEGKCPKKLQDVINHFGAELCVSEEFDDADIPYNVMYFQFEGFESRTFTYEIHPQNVMYAADRLSERS
jgi:hypothetical protein